jgi:glycosyltransferase involved in cell wall biosynthesis
MSLPAASVVIPSYNHGRFIGEAVESVLESPFSELELVVVDDGSSDDSLDRLEPFRADRRVRIEAQPNRGAHAALNRGLELARGEILLILNSDDVFAPERVTRLVELFEHQPETVLAASWIEVIDADGVSLGVKRGYRNMPPWPPPTHGPMLSDLGDPELALLETNFISTTSNIAFRRALIDRHRLRFCSLRYTHDWDLILAACGRGRCAVVEQPLVKYRVHGDNTIREGADRAKGEMRFEVMWTVCRHAASTVNRAVARGRDGSDLRHRLWRSLPRFGCDALLAELLALRGIDADPPPSYDALLESTHPFRRAAVATLASMTE